MGNLRLRAARLSKFKSDEGNRRIVVENFLDPNAFQAAFGREVRRTERTHSPFAVAVFDIGKAIAGFDKAEQDASLLKLANCIGKNTRLTDIKGWLQDYRAIGVICVDLNSTETSLLFRKLKGQLSSCLGAQLSDAVSISILKFPTDELAGYDGHNNELPEIGSLLSSGRQWRLSDPVKRSIDVVGSLLGIVLFFPVFAIVPVLIKLNSRGPVLFRQTRIGYGGKPFVFLKFRSMRVSSDDSVHREYVTRLISGGVESQSGMFKIAHDPRVTAVGRFLRKTSLDELPQFINVLKGEMSLVGPRPPIPYEVDKYDLWHRRRVLDAKPGLTGPWQVTGRSRVSFDEMVRMDIRYAQSRSLLEDVGLILRTPVAMLAGRGAC